MPKLFFLEADRPLTKTFSINVDGSLQKSSYPNVFDVTSHEEDVPSVAALAPLLKSHGAAGHCLLKGSLGRPLVQESRAGSTNPANPTDWICLDLDGVDMPDADYFMHRIGLGDVDYVRQWSASMGLSDKTGKLRCHIFVFLEGAVAPAYLKQWLQHLNFTVPELASKLTLTSTNMALSWTLDITTCQEDKLLYIAPPVLHGNLFDPYPTDRYEFLARGRQRAAVPSRVPSAQQLRAQIDATVLTLRATAGLPERKNFKWKRQGSIDYMVEPDQATATEVKRERGFVYFNLNGGDSWAYYHPEGKPQLIYNFKGEPVYRTQDLLPDYWREVREAANDGTPNSDGIVYLAFCDYRTSQYFKVIYDKATDTLDYAPAKNKEQLNDWMLQHGQMLGDIVPTWTMVYDPHSHVTVDAKNKILNTFKPSDFMKRDPKPGVTAVPGRIATVINSIAGSDKDTADWILNWLAWIVQNRAASRVALVCHGTTSTGKGVFYHRIVKPILGSSNVTQKKIDDLESQFNGYQEGSLFIMIDEIQTSAMIYRDKTAAKLKNVITEPTVSVRRMYTESYDVPNYSNYFLASNEHDPVDVAQNDRRYTIAPLQDKALALTPEQVDEIDAELEDFYGYLMYMQVDSSRARSPLNNAAKKLMIETNQASNEAMAHALKRGILEYFLDALPDMRLLPNPLGATGLQKHRNTVLRLYCELMEDILKNRTSKLSREQLQVIAEFCVGKIPDTPHKFTSMLRHKGINLAPLWLDGRTQRGFTVTWSIPDDVAASKLQELTPLFDKVRTGGY